MCCKEDQTTCVNAALWGGPPTLARDAKYRLPSSWMCCPLTDVLPPTHECVVPSRMFCTFEGVLLPCHGCVARIRVKLHS